MGPAPAKPSAAIRILVVDDSEMVRKSLRDFLRSADRSFAVCGEAADCREAVRKTKELKPDVVILDFALPDGDGLAVARILTGLPDKAVILMYTMYNSPRLEMEAAQAGILRVVSKPAASELLVLLRGLAQSKLPSAQSNIPPATVRKA
jgi:DNA-binding NarL/FixJ family response regulator